MTHGDVRGRGKTGETRALLCANLAVFAAWLDHRGAIPRPAQEIAMPARLVLVALLLLSLTTCAGPPGPASIVADDQAPP